MCLGEDLETVADAQDGATALRELLERPHDLREAGDSTGPEVVAVGEAARHYNGVHALEVGVGVPQLDGLRAGALYTIERVAVAVGSGKDGYAYPQERTSHSYSSIVGLASSRRHIPSTSSAESTSISTRRPMWTVLTPPKPSAGSARRTASPCGSRMPLLGRTRTRT